MTQHAESYLEVGVDLLTEAAWKGNPVKFRVNVKTLNPEGERAFAVVHRLLSPNGGESDRTPSGDSSGLGTYETWTSSDLEVTPVSAGDHTLAIEVYQDGQFIGSGSHPFDVLEP